jgi:hypothetical protein
MGHPSRPVRGTLSALLLVSSAAIAVSGGCEFAIADAVPAFSCEPEAGPVACPPGQVCSLASHQCEVPVAVPEASSAVARDAEAGPMDGTTSDQGAPCVSNTDCEAGFCLNAPEATNALFAAAGGHKFCATTCCSSGECPAGTVCFATGQGANYCVNPAWLGRTSSVGMAPGGAACSKGQDCRSGLCTSSGFCEDTCCSKSSTCSHRTSCAPPTACAFGLFPGAAFDTHFTAACTLLPDASPNGTSCSSSGECQSDFCTVASICSGPCGSSANCQAGQACAYYPGYSPAGSTTSDFAPVCSSPVGSSLPAQPCSAPSDCTSNFCLPGMTGSFCSDVCFADCDCPAALPYCAPMALSGMNLAGNGQAIQAFVCVGSK